MPKPSPFAGLKLSEQVATPPSAALDQQLFSRTPSTAPEQPPATDAQKNLPAAKEPRDQGTKEGSKLANKEGSLEPRNLGTLAATAEPASRWKLDMGESAYRKNTYAFTDDELNALEDIAIHIRRNLDMDVTKNDLVRCAIHGLVADFALSGDKSDAIRRLRKKRPR